MKARAAFVAAICAITGPVTACDSSDASRASDGGEAGTTPVDATRPVTNDVSVRDATTTLDGASTAVCDDDASGLSGVPCILHVDGRAIDGAGAPIAADTLVSACGPAACSPGYTTPTGAFTIPVGFHLDPGAYSVELHVRPDRAGFYYALPPTAPGPVIDVGALRVLDMPAHGPMLDVERAGAPAQAVTSGDVTLDVGGGVYVRLDVESNLAGDHGKEFRALTVARDFFDDFVEPSLGVAALFALEPFESSFEYPGATATPTTVRLSFANTAGFDADRAIDVLALGTYIYPDWLAPGAFQKVASAHVTADGSRVELDAGEGLLHLTWVALRSSS
ncbi:MAG TPA: hypothetical protein VH062_17695 [Polyangiaceae bacterium]|nr:hypothetical protein [Polyangiaceae bacterium]